jgi:Lon protease-like protein
VRRLVGVGVIIAHDPLSDGRSNILLRGVGRARIEEELPTGPGVPYRLVRALWVPDRAVGGDRAAAAAQTLTALSAQLAERLPEGGDTLRALVATQREAGPLSDLLSAALVTRSTERLRVFETLDVLRRADVVADAIAAALRTLGDAGQAPN